LDGFSYDEIAELLEIPRGTVMSRLFYARKQLQAKLTGKFH
jgi:RNA polymerase sigma-70 factor (ECF subfamily)